MKFGEKYIYKTTPIASEGAIVRGEKYRFTVLTSRLIRIEYNENGIFEDRATQTVINRQFDVPEFSVTDSENLLVIATDKIELSYTKEPFSSTSLRIRYIGRNAAVKACNASTLWSFGSKASFNLKGTTRTLDTVNGACKLEDGIMSKGEITVLDDSNSLIICDDGTITPRDEKYIDQYVFCYGDIDKNFDYKECLKDFYKLTGNTPMLPRFALGNWWSRYHAYTQEEYTKLMERFFDEEVPFSVAVIDMDWHYVDIDPKYGTGWTGYTWNKELFPDHKAFLDFLHSKGLEPSLNLHPQEGVGAHEKAYEDMALAMGIDPKTEETVPFEIESPKFIENYFKHLHHPMEEEGVRFWWLDWQQGNTTRIPGLDPLWMLNHFHFIDNEKNGDRGLLFSRYAGPGSHRYPTGFSGDTIITWESLDFQPYFTATASNIGYGWWSHDIGGHMEGYRDEELTARWFQLGTFSPINRLHSTTSEFLGKEPWKYNKMCELSMKKFLKLRHQLIPYLYTMNYRASALGEPLVQPLYYNYSCEEAYNFKNEFLFGTEMIVSPITSPHDKNTTMGSAKTYLPEGTWYDMFNHMRYNGGKIITMFRPLDEMPVLVKSGGIVPMAELTHINDIENPMNMKIKVFAGSSNTFELYEDDGKTNANYEGKYAITKMELLWGDKPQFVINEPTGDRSVLPESRNISIEFVGIEDTTPIVTENAQPKQFKKCWKDGVLTLSLEGVSAKVVVSFENEPVKTDNRIRERLYQIIERMEYVPNQTKDKIFNLVSKNNNSGRTLSDLMQLDLNENTLLALSEIITAEN